MASDQEGDRPAIASGLQVERPTEAAELQVDSQIGRPTRALSLAEARQAMAAALERAKAAFLERERAAFLERERAAFLERERAAFLERERAAFLERERALRAAEEEARSCRRRSQRIAERTIRAPDLNDQRRTTQADPVPECVRALGMVNRPTEYETVDENGHITLWIIEVVDPNVEMDKPDSI